MVVHGSTIIIHGGYNGDSFLNDMWFCSLDGLFTCNNPESLGPMWSELKLGASLSPTSGFTGYSLSSFLASPQERSATGGGSSVPGGVGSDSLPDTAHSSPADSQSRRAQCPSPRSGHSMIQLGPLLVMFGGRHAEGRYNDVHVFNVDTKSWTNVPVKGRPPCGRKTHSFARIGDKAFVFGGHSGDSWMGDLFVLHLQPILVHFAQIPRALGPQGGLLDVVNQPKRARRSAQISSTTLQQKRFSLASTNKFIAMPGILLDLVPGSSTRTAAAQYAVVEALKGDCELLHKYGLDTSFTFLSQLQSRTLQHAKRIMACTPESCAFADARRPYFWAKRATLEGSTEPTAPPSTHTPLMALSSVHDEGVSSASDGDIHITVGDLVFIVDSCIVQARCEYLATVIQNPEWKQSAGGAPSVASFGLPAAPTAAPFSSWSATDPSGSSAHAAGSAVKPPTSSLPSISIPFVEAGVFAAVLYFMYHDILPLGITDENVQELLIAADQLQVTDLSHYCQTLLESRLTVDNVSGLLEFASARHMEYLFESCTLFAAHPKAFPAVAASEAFLQLPHELSSAVMHQHSKLRALHLAPHKGVSGSGSPVGGQEATAGPSRAQLE